jgi:hypothetical protein
LGKCLDHSATFIYKLLRGTQIGDAKIRRKNQVVTAFFERTLRDIKKSQLVSDSSLHKPFRNIRRYRNRRPSKLASQSKTFVTRKPFCFPIDAKHKLMSPLPNQKIPKSASPSHKK